MLANDILTEPAYVVRPQLWDEDSAEGVHATKALLSPSGRRLVMLANDIALVSRALDGRELVAVLGENSFTCAAVTPDDEWLLLCGNDGFFCLSLEGLDERQLFQNGYLVPQKLPPARADFKGQYAGLVQVPQNAEQKAAGVEVVVLWDAGKIISVELCYGGPSVVARELARLHVQNVRQLVCVNRSVVALTSSGELVSAALPDLNINAAARLDKRAQIFATQELEPESIALQETSNFMVWEGQELRVACLVPQSNAAQAAKISSVLVDAGDERLVQRVAGEGLLEIQYPCRYRFDFKPIQIYAFAGESTIAVLEKKAVVNLVPGELAHPLVDIRTIKPELAHGDVAPCYKLFRNRKTGARRLERITQEGSPAYVSALAGKNGVIVLGPQASQDTSHLFLGLKHLERNDVYVEREDDYDEVAEPAWHPEERLIDMTDRSCRLLNGFVDVKIDETYADTRAPVEPLEWASVD